MTREKAIEILQREKPVTDTRECGKELCEACDIAIRALNAWDTLLRKSLYNQHNKGMNYVSNEDIKSMWRKVER